MNVRYDYDKDVDVLYITFSPEKETAAVELNDYILLRFHYEEKRPIGLTFINFSRLIQPTEYGHRSIPLTGLVALEPEWREIIIQILSCPPVNQILTLSSYTPSFHEAIPIASIETGSAAA